MTQQQLAGSLSVSNKAISKWECGNGNSMWSHLGDGNGLFNMFAITATFLTMFKVRLSLPTGFYHSIKRKSFQKKKSFYHMLQYN